LKDKHYARVPYHSSATNILQKFVFNFQKARFGFQATY